MAAWNGWYHCMANTYGTWLPGDARGWRSRDHREHVDGDYKSPPKASYEALRDASRKRLKRPPIHLCEQARGVACDGFVFALVVFHELEVLAVSISTEHCHVLARFPEAEATGKTLRETDPPRHFVGVGKQHSSKALARHGLAEAGGVWAAKGKIVPIRDRAHQLNVFRYVVAHENEGAAVWTFRDELPEDPNLVVVNEGD